MKTRDEDTESQQHSATEQEMLVAEKLREHQVQLEEEIEVEELKAADLNKRFLEEQQHKTDDVWKGVTQKQQEVQRTATDRRRSQVD